MLTGYLLVALVVFVVLLLTNLKKLINPASYYTSLRWMLFAVAVFSLFWPLTVAGVCAVWAVDYFYPGYWDGIYISKKRTGRLPG